MEKLEGQLHRVKDGWVTPFGVKQLESNILVERKPGDDFSFLRERNYLPIWTRLP